MIKRYNKGTILLWLIIACGGIVFLFSARQVVSSGLSKDALLLCVATLAFSILGSVKIPGVKINLTVSDGFVLTSVLFFGIPTATLLGFADAFLASLRITRSNSKRAFNAAAIGLLLGESHGMVSSCFLCDSSTSDSRHGDRISDCAARAFSLLHQFQHCL